MPRKPIDYSKTHFYKIVCKDTSITDCYVGHTTDFTKRKNLHKQKCNYENGDCYNRQVYDFIRQNGNWDNFDMILIDTHNLCNSLEARKKEREYIEQIKPSLNKTMPFRSNEEKAQYKHQSVKKWKEDTPEKTRNTTRNGVRTRAKNGINNGGSITRTRRKNRAKDGEINTKTK